MAMPSRAAPFWTQRTPFTCGPAALANVLQTVGWRPAAASRSIEEARIWRDSSVLACPGSHPWGLALASSLRGHPARVGIESEGPFLFDHIRSDHPGVTRQFYSGLENDLRRRALALGARPARDPTTERVGPGSAGLLLVEAARLGHRAGGPHWVGWVARPEGLELYDPLARRPMSPEHDARWWWRCSGFAGTRAWIVIRTGPGDRGSPRRRLGARTGPRLR